MSDPAPQSIPPQQPSPSNKRKRHDESHDSDARKQKRRRNEKNASRGRGASRGRSKRPHKYKYNKNEASDAPNMPKRNQDSLIMTPDEMKRREILGQQDAVVASAEDDTKSFTLYLKNINPKVKAMKLKELIYNLFVPYGRILDIVAYRTPVKMRGQAFVVLDSVQNATKALHELNGTTFIDRPLNIEFSRSKSFAIGKIDGTYDELRREQRKKKGDTTNKKKFAFRTGADYEMRHIHSRRMTNPSNYLLIENLPEQVGSGEGRDKFIMLLRDRAGYVDVNVKGHDVAIVQFKDMEVARHAKTALDGYVFMDKKLGVSFYRKERRHR